MKCSVDGGRIERKQKGGCVTKELLEFIAPLVLFGAFIVVYDKTLDKKEGKVEKKMALINCPECGKEVSDKAKICIHCGYPLDAIKEVEEPKIKCRYCDSTNIDHMGYCNECGMQTIFSSPVNQVQENTYVEPAPFDGIYKYTLFGRKEVYCPRCGSSDCSHYRQTHVIPGKTKTTYKANLNPLKPFTLVNKKEKVIREEREYTEKKIICHKCGYVFY